MNYISTAERADAVRAMYEFIDKTKESWVEHEPDLDAAAQDAPIARYRQRVAELEHELHKALESRREWMEKVTIDRQRIANLEREIEHLRKA